MKLYHTNSTSLVKEVLSHGFPVSVPDAGGVRLTDRLGPEGLNGQAAILFDIPEEEIRQFEFDELGSSAREFAIPAEVLNRYPIVAVRQPERPIVGSNGAAPAPARSSGRGGWIVLGGLILVVAAGVYAVLTADEPKKQASSPVTPAPERERPAAPSSPSRPARSTPRQTGSVAVGTPERGRLVRGVAFPAAGANHFTWNAATRSSPNPTSRRYGTDYTVRAVLSALKRYRQKNPGAPKVGIGDLSLRRGGDFNALSGGSDQGHQNGLDVVVLYPRLDGAQTAPGAVEQVNRPRTNALLAELARAGATRVSLDSRIGLTVPKGMAQVASAQPRMHVRFRKRS